MMSFLSAVRFLTSIPVPWRRENWQGNDSLKQFSRSLAYYPLVGLLIGLILAGVYWLLSLVMPHSLSSGLMIVAMAIITGGLHLDGFIDTFDGIAGGHKSPEKRKDIMKKPGVGAIGVTAVVLLLLVKYVALDGISDEWIAAALVLTPVMSRWAMVYAVFFFPYARPSGMGDELKKATGWAAFILATLTMLVVAIISARFYSIAVVVLVWLVVLALAAFFRRKFGGLTGDTYGAINEFTETLVFIFIALVVFNNW